MFVHYQLDLIKKEELSFEEKQEKENFNKIISFCEKEGLDVSSWYVFEIAETETFRVYGLESDLNIFYLKLSDKKTPIPCYFKNHGLNEYSQFEADTIKEAIQNYETMYSPIQ